MRYLMTLLVIAALCGGGYAMLAPTGDGASSVDEADETRGATLRGSRGVLRGAGWIGTPPRNIEQPADVPRLLVFVDTQDARAKDFVRRIHGLRSDFGALDMIWLTTAPDAETLRTWMQAVDARGPALYGMEASVPRHFGGGALPMLRFIDKQGRVVARDLIGLKAQSIDH